jgi:hypothetical protein
VRNERSPFGFLKDEGEGIERPGRPHPGEHVGANVGLRLEMIDIFLAKAAVDAVGENDEIGIGEGGLIVDFGFKIEDNAEFTGPLLQDQEQLPS